VATTRQTITVRVERPHETSLENFFAVMRSWLAHHCIMLADFKGVPLPGKSRVFDVVFDNPRDAALFGRRFAGKPTRNVPVRTPSRGSISATAPSTDQSPASILANIAGDLRRVLWTWTKLHQRA
jgi:hypothetical protein